MSETKTISINGRLYDAHTGLVVEAIDAPAVQEIPALEVVRHAHTHAHSVHTPLQRSQTLNRRALKKPQLAVAKPAATPKRDINAPMHRIIGRTKPTYTAHVPSASTSPHITKFAPHPKPRPTTHTPASADIAPVHHPHVLKAHAMSKAKAEAPLASDTPAVHHETAHETKQRAVHESIANTSVNQHREKPRLLKRHPRTVSIVSASIALVLLGSYFTYLNVPSLSTRIAAAEAGINAQYPSYQPDGYSLKGAVSYQQGKVSMEFAANGGPQTYTVSQAKSSWDSSAVLDNYVTPRAGVSYIPYTERGLTIYTFGNNAAWVNGGILYTIDGNAPLSSEQIRQIATSLL